MANASEREIKKAKNKLKSAFATANKADKAKFEQAIDSIMEVPKGQETLMALSKMGYSFAQEQGNFQGFCDYDNKKVVLSPSLNTNDLLLTIVHEARHAVQKASVPTAAASHTKVSDSLRHRRAMEADAVATETAFIYESKDILPDLYNRAMAKNEPTFRSYVDAMEKTGDEKQAMKASFEAWYDDDYYRNFYDKSHKHDIQEFCNFGKKYNDPTLFSESIPESDTLRMCSVGGQSYLDADFLKSEKAFSISKEDKNEILKMTENYANKTGAKQDRSVFSMYVRGEGWTPTPENDREDEPVPTPNPEPENQDEDDKKRRRYNPYNTIENGEEAGHSGTKDLLMQIRNTKAKVDYHSAEDKLVNPNKEDVFEKVTDIRAHLDDKPRYVEADLRSGNWLRNYDDKVGLHYKAGDPDALFKDSLTTVRLGQEKGWTSIKIKGNDEFKEQMYLACRAMGMPVKGFEPSKELLEKGNKVAKEYEAERDHANSIDARFNDLEKIRMCEHRNIREIDTDLAEIAKNKGFGYTPTGGRDNRAGPRTADDLKALGEKRLEEKKQNLEPVKSSVMQKALMNKALENRGK